MSVTFLKTWYYCPLCASIANADKNGNPPQKCFRCGTTLIDSGLVVNGNGREAEELAKQHPMFNQQLHDTLEKQAAEQWERKRQAVLQRKELEELRQRADREAEIQRHLDRNDPRCPICQSFDVTRISGLDRAASIIGLGIFSKKINKTYQCNHCKATF